MAVGVKVKLLILDDDWRWAGSIMNDCKDCSEIMIYQSKTDAASIKNAVTEIEPTLVMIDVLNFGEDQAEIIQHLHDEIGLSFKLQFFANYKLMNLLHLDVNECNAVINKDVLSIAIMRSLDDKIPDENRQSILDGTELKSPNKFIALQTVIGLRFINKKNVVYFEYNRDEKTGKSQWEAFLNNTEIIKLKINTSSKDILRQFEAFDFIQISQSNIINLDYFSSVELKSRKCILEKPFDNKEMVISRAFFNELKSKYELN